MDKQSEKLKYGVSKRSCEKIYRKWFSIMVDKYVNKNEGSGQGKLIIESKKKRSK